MPLRLIAILLVLVGAAMMVAGVVAKQYTTTESFWSKQQAQEFIDASTALKSVATGKVRQPSANDPKLAAAQERFNKIQADLDWAITRRDYTGVALGAGGAAILAIGIGVFLRSHATEKSSHGERPFIRR